MPRQFLNGANIISALRQMRGKGMPADRGLFGRDEFPTDIFPKPQDFGRNTRYSRNLLNTLVIMRLRVAL